MRRRRGPELETALLEAAWTELTERGYAGFALDAVAQRAGTSTPVLYRRWANKRQLIEAALTHVGRVHRSPEPDTGTLRGDLVAVMRSANETHADLLAAMTALLGSFFDETGTSPAKLRNRILAGRDSLAETVFRRAAERGEVDARAVTPRIVALPFDLYRHEVMTTLRPVPDPVIDEIVDDIVLPLLVAARPEPSRVDPAATASA